MKLRFSVLFLAVAGSVVAVSPGDGPGGVGTTDGSSELELWVKADSLAMANGAQVGTWNDASGNGRALVQGVAGLRPVFATAALNALPVVRFTADYFNSLTLPSLGNEFAVVAVVKPVRTGAYHNIIDDEDSGRPMLWVDGAGNYEWSFNSGAVAPLGTGYDLVFAIKRAAGPQYSQLYVNGPAVSSGSGVNFNLPASEVFDLFNRDGGQAFNGDVAEMMIFSMALTAEEIGKIGWYLQQKYALPSGFPPPFPVFSGYQTSPAIYGVNSAISPNAPIVAGASATVFSINPALPAGLNMDTVSGVISGTPVAVAASAIYTVTASFTGHADVPAQLTLEVTAPTLTGYSRIPAVFTRTRPGAPVQPILRGGPVAGFSISPPLPAGLTLDLQTGVISGTPTTVAAPANYTVTANFTGYPSDNFDLPLEVLEVSATLDITEFLAANDTGLTDGDGQRSDWIEIHNFAALTIDLYGWSLTDNAGNLRKWIFPPHVLAPGGYFVVFASGDAHADALGNRHTNFKLDAEGEYLALVQPDGVTIARQFSPFYAQQIPDVSWGTNDRTNYGAYTVPTPGAANGFFTSSSVRIMALPAGGTFSAPLQVSLSAPLPAGAVIRYTLNNTAPVASSPVYSTPFTLTANTRLRARVFQSGLNPGPELRESYLRLGADVQAFSSNLPLVFIHSEGAIAPANAVALTAADAVTIPVDPLNGRAVAAGISQYAGRTGLRLRGRSSLSFPQKQFKLETYDASGREIDVPLMGMPAGSDWVLYAPYTDKSLVRNALAYRTWALLDRPSPQTQFVEVFLNDDNDGQFTYADDYAGIYMLTESVKLDVMGLDPPQITTSYADISGGYLMEMGNADDQDFSTTGSGRAVAHRHGDPNGADLNAVQQSWIRDHVSNFEQALYGAGFVHPGTGLPWRRYTDAASQVDYRIAREWARNFDGGSTFYHVPRGGSLTMGPLWDYNWAFGNVNYAEGGDLPGYRTDGWNRSFTAAVNGWSPWWLRMEQDADWWQEFIDRWTTLREGLLGNVAVNQLIDQLTQPLAAEAAGRHFVKWPQLGQFTVISPPGWETRTTYQSEVDYLKSWLQGRSAWIDSQFPPRPLFSPLPGGITAGSTVTLTAGAGQTIYYTTDGTDPRSPSGGIAPGAQSITSGGSITASASILLTARAKAGAVWGAPGSGGFVTGIPASAANIIISEIAWHPASPTPAELAALPGVDDDDFEYLELRNVSGASVDLTGARFTAGIDFVFPAGTVLAAGAYLVIVENAPAFALRHGAATPVAGQYGGNLDNDGDTVVLVAAGGSEIARLHYRDAWSAAADGRGYTLTLRDPSAAPADYSAASAWGLSENPGGTPAAPNGPVFAQEFQLWRQSTFSAADLADAQRSGPLADPDLDGYSNLMEFACASSPLSAAAIPQLSVSAAADPLTFTFTRARQSLDLNFSVESSFDLAAWNPLAGASLEILTSTATTESVRVTAPSGVPARRFVRLSVALEQ